MRSVKATLRKHDPNTDIVKLDASAYRSGELDTLLSPLLFGESKALYVPNLDNLEVS